MASHGLGCHGAARYGEPRSRWWAGGSGTGASRRPHGKESDFVYAVADRRRIARRGDVGVLDCHTRRGHLRQVVARHDPRSFRGSGRDGRGRRFGTAGRRWGSHGRRFDPFGRPDKFCAGPRRPRGGAALRCPNDRGAGLHESGGNRRRCLPPTLRRGDVPSKGTSKRAFSRSRSFRERRSVGAASCPLADGYALPPGRTCCRVHR